MRRAVPLTAGLVATLTACISGPVGTERDLLVDVCLAYDDLRFQEGVELGSAPETQEMHALADAACDQVADVPRLVR